LVTSDKGACLLLRARKEVKKLWLALSLIETSNDFPHH
jgi:hypothetical protein